MYKSQYQIKAAVTNAIINSTTTAEALSKIQKIIDTTANLTMTAQELFRLYEYALEASQDFCGSAVYS